MLAIRGGYENVRPTSSGASRCDGPRESEGAAGGCAATRLLDVRHSIHYSQDRACTTAFGVIGIQSISSYVDVSVLIMNS
jgi:hypothetical protein